MALQLIDDGYTRTATVKASGWPAVTFVYRPALPAEVRDYVIARAKAQNGADEVKAVAGLLAEKMKSWDVLAGEKPAPINLGTLRRIPDPVLQKFIDVVTGYGAEEAAADEKNSDTGSAST